MITFLFIYLCQSISSHEKYGESIKLLKSKIPIDRTDIHAKNNVNKLAQLFDNNQPSYKEKEKICSNNKHAFDKVGMYILRQLNLEHKITKDQMTRCIARNIHLFAYSVLTMKEQFPDDFYKVKSNYLSSKNNDNFFDFRPEYEGDFDYIYEM